MNLKELKCKNCGAPLEEKDMDQRLLMARCPHCHSVFGLENIFQIDGKKFERRLKVPIPEKFESSSEGGEYRISYRWRTGVHIFLVFFTIGWNTFMLVWHTIALSTGAWFMSLFGIIHTVVGLGLFYYTLAGMLNKTQITAKRNEITIHHSPIFWPGSQKLHTTDITQIYCKEKNYHGKNGSSTAYEVYALKKDGKTIRLIAMLESSEHALFIEQELEKALGIKDRPVSGEVSR